ncbi:hypothetical protein [Oryzicola mucosus]|uniref:hypothetical protein n=1 Tax=Oryzicola mucosus TaxID=2767425 RepID=UPI001E3B09A3|nr:hypothetical protein [Oryzicola mucosus]
MPSGTYTLTSNGRPRAGLTLSRASIREAASAVDTKPETATARTAPDITARDQKVSILAAKFICPSPMFVLIINPLFGQNIANNVQNEAARPSQGKETPSLPKSPEQRGRFAIEHLTLRKTRRGRRCGGFNLKSSKGGDLPLSMLTFWEEERTSTTLT